MSPKKIRAIKPWAVLCLVLFLWAIVPGVLKSFGRASFYEFQAPIFEVSSRIQDLQTFWGYRNHSKADLIEVNRDLARLNAAYAFTQSENRALREEIKRLEKTLHLPEIPGYDFTLARISRRDLAAWSHHMLIQKGEGEGIVKGAAVVFRDRVVGRVKEVYKGTSLVELVSSPTFRIAAHFLGDNRPITYQGMSSVALGSPYGHVANVPTDIEASEEAPRKLVSSRLGGVFPDGLYIGDVYGLEPGTEGIFKQADVKLSEDLNDLQEVAILMQRGGGV